MSTAPFYHVGILVADVEDAVERFSTALDSTSQGCSHTGHV
jgi:hypothetical protein